ncbi:MAG: hypothetical protein FJ004_04120 [Chloroflexi bacterium]|nr:hypothetical protein [Chloroflexota bacterium]
MLKKNGKHPPMPSPLWREIEQEVYALRHLRISPEEKLARAKHYAALYRQHNRPLPDELAILV